MAGRSRRNISAVLIALSLAPPPASAADPSVDQLMNASPDQIRSAIAGLPPEVQDRIRRELQSGDVDALTKMSPDQLRAALDGLSPSTRAALKRQWASLSSDQKAQLKALNPKALLQELAQRFAAMGPTERAIVRKLLGEAAGLDRED